MRHPESSEIEMTASRNERRAAISHTIAPVTTPNSQEGNRAANSLTPKSLILKAVDQKERGGFPQNGIPGLIQGVTQSFCAAIILPISPYLASVVSISG